MLGAIAGDIIGSFFERSRVKFYDFDLFYPWSRFTDDSVMTLAVAQWLMPDSDRSPDRLVGIMQEFGREYPDAGYGYRFNQWLHSDNPQPYGSWGNGSAMRVSPAGIVASTLDEVVAELRKLDLGERVADEVDAINVAIIGRPNAGKSSLTNKLTRDDRSIVSDVAGTTRDAVDTLVEHDGRAYRIVDTAGLRRKSQIDEDVEYYGFVRAMRAIDRADVALLVIDGTLGVTNEDQRVANYAEERGCALIVVLNGMRLMTPWETRF